MRILLRRLFDLATGLSLVLFVLSATGFVRTCWVSESWGHQAVVEPSDGRVIVASLAFTSRNGSLLVKKQVWTCNPFSREAARVKSLRPRYDSGWTYGRASADRARYPFGHFDWTRVREEGHADVNGEDVMEVAAVIAPWWLIAVASGVLPSIWAARRGKNLRRRRRGLCLVCGYDLRATPDRCPECGAVRDAAARTAA